MITPGDITGMGFSAAMFGKTDPDFSSMVSAAISEQSDILKARIGETAYANASYKTLVKRAEKCLAAAELLGYRINHLENIAVASGDSLDVSHLTAQQRGYRAEADNLVDRIISGGSVDSEDFATGATVSEPSSRLRWPA